MTNTILDYLNASARLRPDRTAVSDGQDSLTFSQLAAEVRTLAGRIAKLGLCHRAVGVYAHRRTRAVTGMLAAAAAGCFYVPLNPKYPEAKLRQILEDAGISLSLGCEDGEYRGEDLGCAYISCLDGDGGGTAAPLPAVSASDPLYLIYTSGSTGRPKGILKTHGAMVDFIEAYVAEFGFDETEVLGNQTPFSFDASAKDLYLMLRTGARLEILPTQLFSFPVKLIEYLNEKEITMISWVPSALSLVSRMKTFRDILPQTLRRVFFVGEVFPVKELEAWRSYLPDIQYVNLYGASELAGICCYYQVGDKLPGTLPIGRPLGNSRIYLLGDGGLVTAPGQEGEILVESGALAEEYWNDPEKTAKTLCRLSLDGETRRVLRTGDLAAYDETGNLVYRSRRDHQIKHMGYRIELGEIEAAVNALPFIGECCCLYDEARSRITVFCTTGQERLTVRDLSAALKDTLADYMLPGRVITLDELPRNQNGKLDRVGLRARL